MKDLQRDRDGFKSRWGFTLACVGSAVGMGNIWRFPYMVSEWGGLTFLIPYILFVALIGSTGIIEEIALGRSAQAGPIGAFGKCTEVRYGKRFGQWIGAIPVVGALCLAIGYTVVVGWIFKYMFMAFGGELSELGRDMDAIGGMFESTASAWGNNMWLITAILATAAIMIFGIAGGIEKVNKVMMPLLFGLFLILGIYIFTLPGSEEGYKYIFTLNPEGLKQPELWIFAFGQAFFSLSVAGNGTVIYGSYLGKNEDIVKSARNIAIFDTMASMLATLVIVPSMAVGGAALDTGGPGLMFIYLVNVFNGMPGGSVVAHRILCMRAAGGDHIADKSIRGACGCDAGKAGLQESSGCAGDRCGRLHSGADDTGHRFRLDGRRVHICVSAGCDAGWNHVLLRCGEGLCRKSC